MSRKKPFARAAVHIPRRANSTNIEPEAGFSCWLPLPWRGMYWHHAAYCDRAREASHAQYVARVGVCDMEANWPGPGCSAPQGGPAKAEKFISGDRTHA